MKVIQFFLDDKFVDASILSFINKLDVTNIIISDNDKLKYVKSSPVTCIDSITFIKEFTKIIEPFDIVFFHSLPLLFREAINSNKKEKIYCWFLWGFDYYNEWKIESIKLFVDIRIPFFNKVKNNFIYNNVSFKLFRNNVLKKYYNSEYIHAIDKLDYVAPVLPNEFKKIKFINNNINYLPYTYGNLENYIGSNSNVDLSKKNNILLGNSADPSNNHLSIINKLSKLNLENIKIIVPLSYSGNEAYKQLVLKEGEKKLGDNFVPIVDFMPIEKYNEIVFSCGIVIFNHIRQQAIGNLIVMGYLGAKIFINKKSVTADYLLNKNVTFFTTDEIDSKEKLINDLSFDELKNNKQFFHDNYSKKAVNQKIDKMLKILEENKIINNN